MTRRAALALLCVMVGWPSLAFAQLGRQLETAGVTWTPTIALRDVGTDSNVYVVPGDGEGDRTATFTPSVSAKANSRLFAVQFDGILDFVYFEKFIQERSLNRKMNGRIQAELGRISPFVTGTFDNSRERQGDIDLRLRRRGYSYSGGVAAGVTAKATLEASLTKGRATHDGGALFRGIAIASSLDRRSENLNAGFRYALTSLTNLALDFARVRDFYDDDPLRNTVDQRLFATLMFAPDAVIRGRLLVGYHRLRVKQGVPFKGILADVNIGYTFKESSRLNLRYYRDTNVSFDSPFNLQTQYGIDLVQDIAGPLKATAGISRQNTRHSENVFINQIRRLERYDSYAVGLAFYWSTSIRSALAYDFQRRRSSLPAENFQRRRLLASVSLVL